MATLTSSYQLLKSVNTSTYSQIRLYGKVNSQNDTVNPPTSSISLQLRIIGRSGGSGSFGSGTAKISGTSYALGNTSYGSSEKTLCTKTYTATHNADGTYTKTISFSLTTTGSPNGSGSVSITAPTIKLLSVLDAVSDFNFGSSIPISYTKYINNSKANLQLMINDTVFATKTNVSTSDTISLTLTELNAAYSLAPDTKTPTVQFKLITLDSNDNEIGAAEPYQTATGTITVTPTISEVKVYDAGSLVSSTDFVVVGKAQISFTSSINTSYGSPVSFTYTLNGSPFTSSNQVIAGTNTVVSTLTDGRGNTATKTIGFAALSYSEPTIDTFSVVRCDSNGDEDDGGSYVKINISSSITSLNYLNINHNTKEFKLEYKLHSSSTWTTLETYTSSFTYTKTDVVESGFSSSNDYDFRLTATDMYGFTKSTLYIPTQKTVLDFYNDGTGIAVGKVASTANLFDVAHNTKISGTLSLADEYGDNSVEMFDLTGTPRYDETSSYQTGDYVVYNNSLYKAVNDSSNPAGSFDSDDWSATDIMTEIQSGGGGGGTSNYNDLTNKPSINSVTLSGNKSLADLGIVIPTVNNSTITIQKNGTTVDSFTTNASSGKTINISVPTKTTDLTNDAVFDYSDVLAITSTSDATYTGILNCIGYNIPFKIQHVSGDVLIYEVIKTHSGHHYDSFQYIDDDNILHIIEMTDVGTTVTVTETTKTLVDSSDLSSYSTTSTLQTDKSITKGIEYIVGTQASATNLWTGVSTDTGCSSGTLYTGKTIIYHLPVAGSSSAATLNLTLPDGTTTGAKNIYRLANTTVTTNFAADCDILMVYDGTQWKVNAYVDTNTNTIGYQLRTNAEKYKNGASTSVYRYQLLVQTENGLEPFTSTSNSTGTSKTVLSPKYIPGGNIRYYSATSTIASGVDLPTNSIWQQYNVDLRYSFNITTSTLTSGEPVYIVMEVNLDGTLSPVYPIGINHPITQTLPSTNDGYVYVLLGQAFSGYQIELTPLHTMYEYKNGKIRQYIAESSGGGGTITDVQVNSTSVVTGGVADILTEGTYDSSTNKIATMSDVPAESSIVDLIYPVGSIYISTTSTNPGTIFSGTTWTQIQDTFLLSAGSTYTAGATGGSASHTLTTDELPAHTHGSETLTGSITIRATDSVTSANANLLQQQSGILSRASDSNVAGYRLANSNYRTAVTSQYNQISVNATHEHDSVGGGDSFSTLPPYLVVYMWERTA